MNDKKSLTLRGLVLPNFLFLALSFLMVLIGVYLTQHYFDLKFPTGLAGASTLCNISDFWGCDKATLSIFGNIFGVPTSIFGLMMGVFGIMTALIGKESFERTAKFVFALNFLGCVVLFLYSVFVLESLCPMCTAYYVISGIVFFLFHKSSDYSYTPEVSVLGIFAILMLLPLIGTSFYIGSKESKIKSISNQYVEQFNQLKDYGDPTIESPFKVHMSTENFADAPIRITIFSDFQCPYCKAVSDQVPSLIKAVGNNLNIQYMFYPLDMACNTQMKNSGHAFACQAAYIAACEKEKFSKVHDHIFENQNSISAANLTKWEKEFGLSGCAENKEVKDYVQQTLSAGEQYKLQSTPTIIVNGKKLEGLVPTQHLIKILKSLVK
jgi:protein-disulfide isomerase/uncharacterized membrane protein